MVFGEGVCVPPVRASLVLNITNKDENNNTAFSLIPLEM